MKCVYIIQFVGYLMRYHYTFATNENYVSVLSMFSCLYHINKPITTK